MNLQNVNYKKANLGGCVWKVHSWCIFLSDKTLLFIEKVRVILVHRLYSPCSVEPYVQECLPFARIPLKGEVWEETSLSVVLLVIPQLPLHLKSPISDFREGPTIIYLVGGS